MEDTSKYLIHADVTADGVVERSDVVGAIFGQTEGLLGDELDLRDLRHSQKVGRIDAEIESTEGRSRGKVTIATSLDKVETATLAASLETIDRVGPCRAELTVREIEDVRAAKRKQVVDRATELLRTGFDDTVMSSEEILAEVRQHVRVDDVTEYEGLPAGPRVEEGDAIIVVEGRADVLTLLKYGIKNAVAVEGTNVPEAVAALSEERTTTAFLDGDRGGDLILEELTQVGDVDYVAFAPEERSVEELGHHEVFTALRNKTPYDAVAEESAPREVAATDGSATPAPAPDPAPTPESTGEPERPPEPDGANVGSGKGTATPGEEGTDTDGDEDDSGGDPARTVYDHATEIVREGTGRVRYVDDAGTVIAETDAGEAYDRLASLETVPETVVVDGVVDQKLADLAADRGVARIVGRSLGEFTKRPTAVRLHSIADVAPENP
ncbi:DNA primase DnaG [Saliphagus infecundisoli]|uniref:DNA primase DnaG n=1 Tax=Saliphagus infecundisoli TaxID=1849069 RepID=A0ABD5QGG5_9EURY|nr:DNA primase DnaG [Saliphagus infecundisoli]